ncbi:NAD(P)H-dependent flavin oxidoreductase [Actinocorallia populi]|uniref:NAD(P)H-dependent flavin oxidoreductase n=1 Tax=Actinocorallia populi TaxID=2079200 RepID=UPI000D0920E1|nr:nitronate monooxygenase [Actinocorallia populi]
MTATARARRDTRGLALDRGVMLAGMGGVAGPGLAAAVGRAGGLGVVGAYKATGADLAVLLRSLTDLTAGPAGVGLVPEAAGARILAAQVEQILATTPSRILVVGFGLLPSGLAARLRTAGRRLIVQVGTADDADAALLGGAHAVVLQGAGAGGRLLGDRPLLPLLREVRTRHPQAVLLAAGGLTTADAVAAAAEAGADGVCSGTAFIAAAESDAHPLYRRRVVEADAADTVVTGVFDLGWPGRRHRVLRSAVTDAPGRFPRTPIGFTTVGRTRHPVYRFSSAAPTRATRGRIDHMAMYAGTSCARVDRVRPAAEIVADLGRAFEEDAR